MAAAATRGRLTVDDLDAMPEDGILRELADGELREWMAPGPEHGEIEADLSGELRAFVKARRLGKVMAGEVRFLIRGNPHRARMADVAFVAAGKYPAERAPAKADATVPDFVAEVISPDDQALMVQEKVRDWLDAGVRLLWLIYPNTREVMVYRPGFPVEIVPDSGVLSGHDVFPGLQLAVKSFLP